MVSVQHLGRDSDQDCSDPAVKFLDVEVSVRDNPKYPDYEERKWTSRRDGRKVRTCRIGGFWVLAEPYFHKQWRISVHNQDKWYGFVSNSWEDVLNDLTLLII